MLEAPCLYFGGRKFFSSGRTRCARYMRVLMITLVIGHPRSTMDSPKTIEGFEFPFDFGGLTWFSGAQNLRKFEI